MQQTLYQQADTALANGEGVCFRTHLQKPAGTIQENMKRSMELISLHSENAEHHLLKPVFSKEGTSITFEEPFLPKERLIILGGGHISLALCKLAAVCGFHIVVVDDRPSFANRSRFPMAKQVLCTAFEEAIQRLNITPYDYITVLTRGHVHDADCLRAVLKGVQPFYLGMVGSKRRVKSLLAMLEEEGYPRTRLDHICSPIGLKIGAVTPEEIAVSILAEVISYKRLPEYQANLCFGNGTDADLDMLRYLANDSSPKAIITVMETKGSTPRRAGAKLAVNADRTIIGSIGGGCAESAAILEAIDLIGTGQYKVRTFDMTGDIAESDGMVCGGIMTVLIEDGTPAR